MRHIITILLQNEAGALSRVANLFSTRAYNIESLAVAPTLDAAVSKLTLVTTGDDLVISQLINQLRKLVDVVSADDITKTRQAERELLLIKLEVSSANMAAVQALISATRGNLLSASATQVAAEVIADEAGISQFLMAISKQATIIDAVRSGPLAI
jgi:acetolactate synthase-1/3 small subunit